MSRVPRDLSQSLLQKWSAGALSPSHEAARQRQSLGLPMHDFIGAQPLDFGFGCVADATERLREACASTAAYRPDCAGQPRAREAVAQWHGATTTPDSVILTPGTSLGYLLALRLLSRPRSYVLVPRPSYPLFDALAELAGVGVRHYAMSPTENGWAIDLDDLRFQMTQDCVAVVVVSPHNPTGAVASADELVGVCGAANAFGAAVLFDEVFRTMTLDATLPVPRPSECGAELSVTLNGLSKMLSLPGIKAAWMVIEGATNRVKAFTDAAHYAMDSLLPVSEITQTALPSLLELWRGQDGAIRERWRAAEARARIEWGSILAAWGSADTIRKPDAAPYLLLPLPRSWDSRDAELRLVERYGMVTHAGAEYGLPDPLLVVTVVRAPSDSLGEQELAVLRDANPLGDY